MNLKWLKRPISYFLLCSLGITLLTGCTSKEEKQQAYKEKGLESMSGSDYGTAVEYFDKALSCADFKVSDKEVDLCYYKAASQYLVNDFDGAIETYTALIDFDDSNADAYFLRGSLYLNGNETDKGLADYQSAVAADTQNYDRYIEIYNNLVALDMNTEALEFLNLALEVEGNSAENLIGRGRVYLLLGQYDSAISALNSAIEKHNNLAKLYLADVYTAEGNDEKATEILQEYTEGESTGESLNALGNLQMKNENYQEALDAYQKALALGNIDNEKEVRKNEVGALEYTGDFATAYDKANEYIKDYPNDQDMLRELVFLTTRVQGPYEHIDTSTATDSESSTDTSSDQSSTDEGESDSSDSTDD